MIKSRIGARSGVILGDCEMPSRADTIEAVAGARARVPHSESIDRDSKHQGEYAQDFSGILADFFSAAGAALAGARAAGLGPSSSSRRANMLPVIAMVACGRGADGGRVVPSLN